MLYKECEHNGGLCPCIYFVLMLATAVKRLLMDMR